MNCGNLVDDELRDAVDMVVGVPAAAMVDQRLANPPNSGVSFPGI